MDRRTYLRTVGAGVTAGLAGCLGSLPGTGDGRTVLGPPEQTRGDPSHPIHGEDFPTVSLPDPLAGEVVDTADFRGERAIMITFVYTSCHDGSCPMLLSRLRYAQEHAAEEGFADDVAFLAMTFDPKRDTEDVLRQEAHDQGVDLEAGNWHFLRPETNEEAATILEEEFGLVLEQADLEEHADGEHGGRDDDEDDHGDHDEDETDEYDIIHYNLILLVNEDGVVERSYPNATTVEWSTIADDLETVVEGDRGLL